MPIPAPAYQPTTYSRQPRPTTTQQPSYYKPTQPFKTPPPPRPAFTTQPVSSYKPILPKVPTQAVKFFSGIPKGGGAALAILFELLFPPPAGDNYYDRNPKNPPPKYKLQPPEPAQELEKFPPPFKGGQGQGIRYRVIYTIYETSDFGADRRQTGASLFGAIGDIRLVTIGQEQVIQILCRGDAFFENLSRWVNVFNSPLGAASNYKVTGAAINYLFPESGGSDPYGDPPSTSPPVISPPGKSLGAPSAAPPSTAPSPLPRAPGISPSGDPGDAPKRFPGGFPSPTPAPNPGPTPQPDKYPGGLPGNSPAPAPNGNPGPAPGSGLGPAPAPTPKLAPRPAPTDWGNRIPAPADPTKYPDTGFQPLIFGPNPLAPNPLAPAKFAPNPKTGDPEPKKAPPLTSPPKSPDPTPTPTEDLGKQIQNWLGPLTIALAGITALVHPDVLKNAANAGSCQSFAPGGCNAPIANNAQASANNSANNGTLLASIMAFLQAMQAAFMVPILAGVNLVNTKLGPLMSGLNGIGGFLGRLSTSLGVDRVISLATTAAVIHNCMMLSSSISDTLFSTLDNVFAIPSLIKDPENATVDSKEVFTKYLDGMFASIFGTTEWVTIKNQWKAYSTIYNTGSQVFGNIRDIFDETGQIQEVTRNWVAELGNGLQDEGLIGENNWDTKDPKANIKGKYFARLQKIADGLQQVENVAEDLEQVTQSARSIVETANEIKENAATIKTAVDTANTAAIADRAAKEEGLDLPNFSLGDLF